MIKESRKSEKTALIIFAREPKDGKVKTRLCKDLPIPTVTRLYKAFVKDVLHIALSVKCDKRFIYYVGNGDSIPFLRQLSQKFILKRQMGKDLGERMHRAFVYCQKNSFDKIIIIGTDCVTLTKQDIEKAFKKLETHDCVLGPSEDGGYYLIALKLPHFHLFQGVDWSTSLVLDQTLQKARKLNKKAFLLGKREDIDTVIHLKKLSESMKNRSFAHHTQRFLNNSFRGKYDE